MPNAVHAHGCFQVGRAKTPRGVLGRGTPGSRGILELSDVARDRTSPTTFFKSIHCNEYWRIITIPQQTSAINRIDSLWPSQLESSRNPPEAWYLHHAIVSQSSVKSPRESRESATLPTPKEQDDDDVSSERLEETVRLAGRRRVPRWIADRGRGGDLHR